MDLSPWSRVFTKEVLISKGSYGYGETRKCIPLVGAKTPLTCRAVTQLCLKGVGIGPRKEPCVNWGGPIAMVPCLHQVNIYIKRKPKVWRDQKCIFLLGAKTTLTCAVCQTTTSLGSPYRPLNANLHKLGWTNLHGTVFAPR